MKKIIKILFYLIIFGVIAAGAWRTFKWASAKAKPPSSKTQLDAVPVRVDEVRAGCVTNAIKLTGSLEAIRTVDVAPKIAGRLEKLEFPDGTPVLEGVAVSNRQIIAVIDHRDIDARLAQANAAVETARTAVETARIVRKDRDRERQRMEKLFTEGSTTEQQRDLAVTDYEQSVTRLAQAEAELVQARTAVGVIKVNLDEAFVHAPMQGVISAKYADPGAMVNASTRIVQIIPMEDLKFMLALPGPHLHLIKPGRTEVDVYSDAVPDHRFMGVVARVHPAVDPVTRTATLEVRLKNRRNADGEWLLRPGLYAEGRIILDVRRDVVVLPADVLLRRGTRYLAFALRDGKAVTRELTIGARDGNLLEIVEGLELGERIVVMGQHRLANGTPVVIAE